MTLARTIASPFNSPLPWETGRRLSSGSMWSPITAAAVCLSWHRADLLVTTATGGVSVWGDSSGNGRTFEQTDSAKRCADGVTLGGQAAFRFTAANADHLILTGTSYGSPTGLHVIRVMKRSADPSAAAASSGLDTWGPVSDGAWPWTSGIIYDTTAVTTVGTYATVGNPTASMASLCVYESIALASAFKAKLNGNAGHTYSGATLGCTLTANPIIGGSTSAARYFDGDLAEVMVFSSELGAGDRAGLAAYTLARYGLTIT